MVIHVLRKMLPSAAKSGTTNLANGIIVRILTILFPCAKATAKYIHSKGKGIRGMKKVNEYIVESKTNRTDSPSLSELLVCRRRSRS